jgi:tellurite resistance protein TehA-like permease
MQLGPGSHRPVSARQAFPPVYFAMVMATGIVSIAVYLNGMQRLAATLMWLNVVLFIAFWILLIGRLALAPRGLLEELTSFKLAPGFVTIVAGTSVLARQLLIIQADIRFPIAMFCFAFPVWASFIYLIFTAFKVKEDKPDLANGIHGGWHLSVVATQSVGMLAALLANQLAAYRQQLLFLSLGACPSNAKTGFLRTKNQYLTEQKALKSAILGHAPSSVALWRNAPLPQTPTR